MGVPLWAGRETTEMGVEAGLAVGVPVFNRLDESDAG